MKFVFVPITCCVSIGLGACYAGAVVEGPTSSDRQKLSTSCSGDAIGNPVPFEWTDMGGYFMGTLEVSEATFNMDGDTLTTRAYRQPGISDHSIPGPTLRMQAGQKYVLRFENGLPYEPLSTDMNVLKDPNASNVHTHGLHISGESPSDDVSRTFEGGFGGDFVYDIPDDHMGGTYWYHAHHHGSTYLQVSAGTFGMLIIEDKVENIPDHVLSMPERELVLGYLDPGVAGTGGDTLISGTLSPTWTINGQKQASLCTPANEWQRWRILVADRDAKSKTVSFGAGCEARLLARDGVWRTTVPKAAQSSIRLTGASRADFAVRCDANTTLSVANNVVAQVMVGAEGDTSPHPFDVDGASQWQPPRPDYLRDLRNESNVHMESIRMGARTVNGSRFDHHNANLTLAADQIQEWSLSGSAQHPFHLHIYHVQSQNCTGGDFEAGEYYDVMAQNCTVRFDMNVATTSAFEGRTIMHCHILQHEDQGAMGWMDVQGGEGPPTFPLDNSVSPPFAAYYALAGGTCGDGSCGAGEDCSSCAADCGACSSCGDGSCDAGEDCNSCAADCGACSSCGDGSCDAGEDCNSCAADCGPCQNDCGNGLCDVGEDCNSCSADCQGVTSGRPTNRYCCGNGSMESAEGDGTLCDGNY